MAEPVPDVTVLFGLAGICAAYLWHTRPLKVLAGRPKLGKVYPEPYDYGGLV